MASIISVNVSQAKGERKKPAGTVELRAGHGIVGDGHAGEWHRQVSLLAQESIDSMCAKGLIVGPGDFAENVTTEGIDLPRLVPGMKLRLGPALIEVTQIGKKCHDRCEIFRQTGDCVMPREGVFARVIEGGTVGPGERIEVETGIEGDREMHVEETRRSFTAAVVTVSDTSHKGGRRDSSGELLEKLLKEAGAAGVRRVLVPDDRGAIAAALRELAGKSGASLVITTGGTGLSPSDVTPEATREVIEREAPGFAEAIRAASMNVTKRAMLSRGVSGIRGRTLIINFPGSPAACAESFAILEPVLEHALEVLAGEAGECARE